MNSPTSIESPSVSFSQIAKNLMKTGYFKKAEPCQLIAAADTVDPYGHSPEAQPTWNILA